MQQVVIDRKPDGGVWTRDLHLLSRRGGTLHVRRNRYSPDHKPKPCGLERVAGTNGDWFPEAEESKE